MLNEQELQAAKSTTERFNQAVLRWRNNWDRHSEAPEKQDALYRIWREFYTDAQMRRCHLKQILYLLDGGEARTERVTETVPDCVDVVTRNTFPNAYDCVRQYRLRKIKEKWRIDKIINTRPLSGPMFETGPNARSLPPAYTGSWAPSEPARVISQEPALNVEETFLFMRGKGRQAIRLHPLHPRHWIPCAAK